MSLKLVILNVAEYANIQTRRGADSSKNVAMPTVLESTRHILDKTVLNNQLFKLLSKTVLLCIYTILCV